ncbi:MAG: hypothetical protein H6806_00290 [Planctomycetes bacterium]|nr:hypothetical protein [Planctomycetota bacterium]MCB9826383.1 hypothetical protein [Planctomycetota bacterium]MCB9828183.1 hypothetical protein [Planctomycetota bacterium]
MPRILTFLLAIALLPGLVLLAGCGQLPAPKRAADGGHGQGSSGSSGAKAKAKSDEGDADELDEDERLDLEDERMSALVDYSKANWELERLKLEDMQEERRSRVRAEKARQESEDAKRKLEVWEASEKPERLARLQLNLDQGRDRLVQAEQELKELEAMYAAEEFANMTKELVLYRGRKQVEFAKRDLDLDEQAAKRERESEIPLEENEKRRAAEEAHNDWIDANEDLERSMQERALGIWSATQEIEALRRKIRRVDKKLGSNTNLGTPDADPNARLITPAPPGLPQLPGMGPDGLPQAGPPPGAPMGAPGGPPPGGH